MVEQKDAEFILELYSSEDFLRFVGDKGINTVGDAQLYIQNNIHAMHEVHGVCLLLVERSDTKEKLGVCGLIKRPELTAYDIGYGFKPAAYGQGYGYEAGQAVIACARTQPEIDELVAITTSDNGASQALLTKLGFTYVKVQEAISDTVDLLLYQMSLDSE
ncbi:putative acetyltransferase [Vibrio orientalis CIP 102891 = ATCC 33934]|uniref:Acetyltransferase n=2 Tax=Vibrio orientalis CIP 102891 = ATCC 33934 TaxID=675816 RepID=A0ABP2H3L9_VIBOR|nr:putative acetyltransferase [Vibrio orientalis CIP 102891 = ATCC 33934]